MVTVASYHTGRQQFYHQNMAQYYAELQLLANFFTQEQVRDYKRYWGLWEAQQQQFEAAQSKKAEKVAQIVEPVFAEQNNQIQQVPETNSNPTVRLLREQISQVASRITLQQLKQNTSPPTLSHGRNARSSRAHSSSPPRERTDLIPSQVTVGMIVFLPDLDDREGCFRDGEKCDKKDRVFYHPVVILKKSYDDEQTNVLCYSISGTPPPFKTSRSFPIRPAPKDCNHQAHANSTHNANEIMYLEEGSGNMFKQSYILTQHVYSFPLSKLRSFGKQRLSENSYQSLITNSILNLENKLE